MKDGWESVFLVRVTNTCRQATDEPKKTSPAAPPARGGGGGGQATMSSVSNSTIDVSGAAGLSWTEFVVYICFGVTVFLVLTLCASGNLLVLPKSTMEKVKLLRKKLGLTGDTAVTEVVDAALRQLGTDSAFPEDASTAAKVDAAFVSYFKDDEQDLQCRPQCGLAIFPKLGMLLIHTLNEYRQTRAKARAKSLPRASSTLFATDAAVDAAGMAVPLNSAVALASAVDATTVEGATPTTAPTKLSLAEKGQAALLLAKTGCALSCVSARSALRDRTVCKAVWAPRKEFGVTLRTLLDEAKQPFRLKAMAAADEHGVDLADISTRETWPRAVELADDLAETIDVVCDEVHTEAMGAVLDQALGHKINVPTVVTRAMFAALQVSRLGDTLGKQAESALTAVLKEKLGGLGSAVTGNGGLKEVISQMWAKLLKQILADERLRPLLRRLINSLADARALAPIHTLWMWVIVGSVVWLVALFAFGMAITILYHIACGSECRALVDHYDNAYFSFMSVLVLLVVGVQLVASRAFLFWKKRKISFALLASIERTLLATVVDDEVLAFLRFVADTAVDLLIVELVGANADDGGGFMAQLLANPLRHAYTEWGGTDAVVETITTTGKTKVRPAIVRAFTKPLKRSEEDEKMLLDEIEAEVLPISDLQEEKSRRGLEKVFTALNDGIQKYTTEVLPAKARDTAAVAIQRVQRANSKVAKATKATVDQAKKVLRPEGQSAPPSKQVSV